MASVEKRAGSTGTTWQARWRDPDGRQRKQSFARKLDADRFLATIEADKLRGRYIDPDAGRITFKEYAETWLAAQTFDESTRHAVELRLRVHVTPVLGGLELRQIKPSTAQQWLRGLDKLAASYRRVIFANVGAILSAAVDDELIAKNPLRAASVRRPAASQHKITPWPIDRLHAVHDALPDRYAIVAALGAGLGLRQGEIFGLAVDDVDFLRGRVTINQQVKLFPTNKSCFSRPKGRKTRTVPLPTSIGQELAAYLKRYPPVFVTLPWETSDGEPRRIRLILTTRERTAVNRNYFNASIWKPALRAAGVPDDRGNGCHALRHLYASMLLDAGESIKAVSEYLGHADAGFTLRTYTHMMPSSDDRTKTAVDRALSTEPDDQAITKEESS